MAGTLTISTLSDGTNSTSSTNCIKGSAKAWCQFGISGTTVTINKSYNISSVTRTAAGYYTTAFTNNLADNQYAVSGCASINTVGTLFLWFSPFSYGTSPFYSAPTTSGFAFATTGQTGAQNDPVLTSFSVFD